MIHNLSKSHNRVETSAIPKPFLKKNAYNWYQNTSKGGARKVTSQGREFPWLLFEKALSWVIASWNWQSSHTGIEFPYRISEDGQFDVAQLGL